jgi:hypothetical protein
VQILKNCAFWALCVAGAYAASLPTVNLSASAQEVEILAGQTVRFNLGDIVIEMKSDAGRVGEFSSPLIAEGRKLFGVVRFLDYKIVKGKGQMALEKVQTITNNVRGLPTKFERPAEVRDHKWNDTLVLADDVPLPANSVWEIRQELFLDGQKFAQFRIRLTPDSVRMFWEPTAPITTASR